MELCRRTRIGAKQPAILVDFAMFAATGKRRPPNSGQGRNFISVNENLQILIAVRVLVKDYEFSKRAAYETVSDWLKEADWCSALSADAVRKRVRRMEKARPFPKGGDTNPP